MKGEGKKEEDQKLSVKKGETLQSWGWKEVEWNHCIRVAPAAYPGEGGKKKQPTHATHIHTHTHIRARKPSHPVGHTLALFCHFFFFFFCCQLRYVYLWRRQPIDNETRLDAGKEWRERVVAARRERVCGDGERDVGWLFLLVLFSTAALLLFCCLLVSLQVEAGGGGGGGNNAALLVVRESCDETKVEVGGGISGGLRVSVTQRMREAGEGGGKEGCACSFLWIKNKIDCPKDVGKKREILGIFFSCRGCKRERGGALRQRVTVKAPFGAVVVVERAGGGGVWGRGKRKGRENVAARVGVGVGGGVWRGRCGHVTIHIKRDRRHPPPPLPPVCFPSTFRPLFLFLPFPAFPSFAHPESLRDSSSANQTVWKNSSKLL